MPEPNNATREGFLVMAREAEKAAAKAVNPEVKKAWQQIAQNYRTLAESVKDGGDKA